jgi:hypothetical protein
VGTVASGFEPRAQRLPVDEVGERLLAVDLDHRQQLAVAPFELDVAADVDDLEVEPDVVANTLDNLERTLAEAAVSRVVDRDASYG